MSTDLNKIVDFFVVPVNTAGKSSKIEKKIVANFGWKRFKFSKNNYTDNWSTGSNKSFLRRE